MCVCVCVCVCSCVCVFDAYEWHMDICYYVALCLSSLLTNNAAI